VAVDRQTYLRWLMEGGGTQNPSPIIMIREISMREWKELGKMDEKGLNSLDEILTIKVCHCGKRYSFDSSFMKDPKECPSCRDDFGELIL
jgi:hypothetical protein